MKKKLPYGDIEILVYAYQEGSKDALEKLIAHYEGYFMRFLGVLKAKYAVYKDGHRVMRYTKFDIYNNTQRRFAITFLVSKYDRRIVKLYRRSTTAKIMLYKAVGMIRHLLEDVDSDDLLQIMRLIFVEMASRHKGTKFYNYVSTTFPKMFLGELLKLLKRVKEDPFDEENVWEYGYIQYDEYNLDKPRVSYRVQSDQTMYDDNWINGDCGDIFDVLTPFERRLLKMYFEEGTFFPEDFQTRSIYHKRRAGYKTSDGKIADYFGCSRKTINQKRLAAVASVRERVLDERLVRE